MKSSRFFSAFVLALSLMFAVPAFSNPVDVSKMENAVSNAVMRYTNPTLTSFTPTYQPNGSYTSLVTTLEFSGQWTNPSTGVSPVPVLNVVITYSAADNRRNVYTNLTANMTVSYGGVLPGTNQPWYTGYITNFVLSTWRITAIAATSISVP